MSSKNATLLSPHLWVKVWDMKAASLLLRDGDRHLDRDAGRDRDGEGTLLMLFSANAFSECSIIF